MAPTAAAAPYRRRHATPALVTGASRGLGLALARALADARLAPGHRRARRGRARGARAPSSAERRGRRARRRRHRPGAPRGARRGRRRPRIDLLVNNASVLGPSPLPALADYPLDALERVYRVNVARAAGAGPARAAAARRRRARSSTSPPTPPSSRTRAGAATARRRPRSSSSPRSSPPSSRAARLRGRPGRHAHADAPGGVPRRGHLRPAAARGERAGPARADRGRRCRAAATARASSRRRRRERRARRSRGATSRPRRAAPGRDDVRLLVATARDGALAHARFGDLPSS